MEMRELILAKGSGVPTHRWSQGVLSRTEAHAQVGSVSSPNSILNHLDNSHPPTAEPSHTLVGETQTHPFDAPYYDKSIHTDVCGSASQA